MTDLAGRRFSSVWPIWAWIMVAFGLAVTGAGILGGVFARSLLLDLISFWPGLILVMLVAAALYPFHRGQWSRLAAVVPLLVLSWLGSTIVLHLAEWSVLPSAAADYEGPPSVGIQQARMSVSTGGELSVVVGDSAPLYVVKIDRGGGATPAARSLERVEGGTAQVTIDEREPDTWFVTSGWRLSLSSDAIWSVDLSAADVQADLRGGRISSLRLAGAGEVTLPEPVEQIEVVVEGAFVVELPDGAPMAVNGANVTVPAGWTEGDGEWVSPGTGDGYIVTVTAGASLVVRNA